MSNVEENTYSIELKKLALEEKRDQRESRFFTRHAGAIISAFVSVIAILASAYQNIQSSIQRTEDRILEFEQKKQELETSKLELRRNVAELFIQNDKTIFMSDQQTKNRFIKIFIATLPNDFINVILPELSSTLVTSAEDYSTIIGAVQNTNLPEDKRSAIKTAVEQSIKQASPQNDIVKPTVYVHYKNIVDASSVDKIIDALRQDGYKVPGKQLVQKSTNGDIRYYKP